jgi:hypothetical protein
MLGNIFLVRLFPYSTILCGFQSLPLTCSDSAAQNPKMKEKDKTLSRLTREFSSLDFKRGRRIFRWTSTCIDAPDCRQIASRSQEKSLLDALIVRGYENALSAGSTCRGSKDAIHYTAISVGKSDFTVRNTLRRHRLTFASTI